MTTEGPVDPGVTRAKIEELKALEQRDPNAFAEALADNIMEPDPVETAAFRSEELAFLAFNASKYLIDHANVMKRQRRRGSRLQVRTDVFIQKVGRERRVLQARVDGLRAERGILPNAPNPRGRAMRRLWNEAMRGPVPEGRWRELLDEEAQRDRDKKRDQKRARAQAKKEARGRRS